MCFKIVIYFVFSFSLVPQSISSSEEGDDGKSSLVFVFDTTGSMYNDLRQLREGAEMILNTALEESDVIADFVFVPFHDPAIGPATVTKDKEVFKKALNAVEVYGGGDCPEKSLGGIQLALSVCRPRSFVYVFTDATASDHRLVGSVLDSVQRKQSQVVFVLTGHCNDLDRPHFKVYRQIAAASSGQLFNLNKTSVHKVLDFVRTSIRGRTVNLGTAFNPPGYNYSKGIPVDSNLKEVTVSVSGSKPAIRVVSPSGAELTGPPKLITTLDLSEIMVVKVLQPESGNWTILTGSEDSHSVKVVGVSNLTFSHGFSVERPESIAETSYRPLQGAYNYMMISLSQKDRPVRVSYAEVLSLEGRVMFEVPLREVDSHSGIYLADPFVPPDEFFYISINGLDDNNQELRRVGATAVQSKLPSIPYLTVSKKVEARAHESVTLTCNIESLVPLTAMWTKDSLQIQPQISSLQSTSIQYVIHDTSEADSGTYRCEAKNVAGNSRAATDVTLLVDPPQVIIFPENTIVDIGNNITLQCTVVSEALLLRHQLVFNGTLIHYVTDINMEPNVEGLYAFNKTLYSVTERDSGEYSCVASNRGGENSQSTYITVRSQPTAQIIGPHTLTKLQNTDVQLVCHVERAHHIVWLAPNGDVVRNVSTGDSLNDMFVVRNVSEDGVWGCTAVRGSLNASDTVEIRVLIKPEVSIAGSDVITILNGTKIDITCDIIAKPTPRILWHRETEDFLNNTVTALGGNRYRSVLTLDSRKDDVKGTYFCFGENSEGIHQDSVVVDVVRRMRLEEGFQDTDVQLCSQIALPCRIDSYPPPTIQWYHNDTSLNTSDHVYLAENDSILYILRVEFGDLGRYRCEADNGRDRMTVEGSLSVIGLEIPLLQKEPVQLTFLRGESTKITCSVRKGNPQPSLTWQYKSDYSGVFTALPIGVIPNEDNTQLVISNVEPEQSGTYRCTAENLIGTDTYDIALIVQYPPQLEKESSPAEKQLIVEAGKRVTLSCQARGVPPPIVIWSKDFQPVGYSKNIYLTDANEMVIEKATEYDSGLFTCKATSALGSTQRNFTLVVYVPPIITPPNIGPEVEVLEGDLVELPCEARGVPAPTVYWLQNGQAILDERKQVNYFGLRFVANLTDFGAYTCVASNSYGNTSMSFSVYIWVPPYIEPVESSTAVLLGGNISLECNVVGFPLPSVTWEFQDQLLRENTTDLSFNEFGNLYITKATSKREGLYSCVAENLAGLAKKSTYLYVNELPKILEDNFTGTYIASEQDMRVVIPCRATGTPEPHIAWMKDDRYIDNDSRYDVDVDGTLTIKEVSQEQSGDYICIAKNSIGSAQRIVPVEIYSLPARMQADESQTSVSALEGTNVTAGCPIRASDKDKVKWYKDAKLISTNLLTIYNITRDNASTYACVVTNAIGSAFTNVYVNVEWSPKFVSEGVNTSTLVEVVKGDDWYFDCGVDAKPVAKTKWLFNSKVLFGENKERLKLNNIQQLQTGNYKCIVSNAHGTVHKQYMLDVLVPPFISEFDLLDVQLQEGTNASLECASPGDPPPNITWTYNNTNWHQENASLTAYNIGLQDAGLYRCDAANKAGAAHLVYRVTVTSPARVEEVVTFSKELHAGVTVDDTADVVLESHVRMSCKASGIPPPTIQWFFNGKVVGVNGVGIGYADVNVSCAGVYTCIAASEGGGDSRRDIRVNILEPPKIFQDIFGNGNRSDTVTKLEVISGQSFYLHCHPYGNPAPAVYWFKDGMPLRLFDDTMESMDFGEVLASTGATNEQSGTYTCVARNKVGNATVVYLVEVLLPPPTPKDNTRNVNKKVGKQLVLECPVEGTPLPEVMWIKHPYTEIGSDSSRISLANDKNTLIINKTEVTDSGKYSCIMTNKLGTTEVVFLVTIEEAPSIGGNVNGNITESATVALYRSFVLKCQVHGHPMPTITWLKDTQVLSESSWGVHRVLGNSLLVVWSCGARHAGQYICVAENSAGTSHRRYNVRVQVPGKWSEWSEWSLCNVTCGLGYQQRGRRCQYTDNSNTTFDKSTDRILLDESGCKGAVKDRRKCHMPPCGENRSRGAPWGPWSAWGPCSATCGSAAQARSRTCRIKGECIGDNVQIRKCVDLPGCAADSELPHSAYEEFSSTTGATVQNVYNPEAIFEVNPEVIAAEANEVIPAEVNGVIPAEVNEVYISSDDNYPRFVYDVIVTENLDKSDRGPCPPGYKPNNLTHSCEDVDECLISNNKCHMTQVCVNTPGAYRCTCSKGFLALGAGQRCLDMNECSLDTSRCEYACVNTAGGYVCACPKHMRLHIDKHHCVSPSLYSRPDSHEDSGEYLSTSVEFPRRYLKDRS